MSCSSVYCLSLESSGHPSSQHQPCFLPIPLLSFIMATQQQQKEQQEEQQEEQQKEQQQQKQTQKRKHQKATSTNAFAVFLSMCLFTLCLFSLPPLVGATDSGTPSSHRSCGNKGFINATTGLCECLATYQGYSCEYRVCPYGKAWLAYPTADHTRAQPRVECSNMGSCDVRTGVCVCREGYEGRACERKSCPGERGGERERRGREQL